MKSFVRESKQDLDSEGLFFVNDEPVDDDYLKDFTAVKGDDLEGWKEAVAYFGEERAKEVWQECNIPIPDIKEGQNEPQSKPKKQTD